MCSLVSPEKLGKVLGSPDMWHGKPRSRLSGRSACRCERQTGCYRRGHPFHGLSPNHLWQVWLPQYRAHFSALLLATIAQLRSTPARVLQSAAVREPLPFPLLTQVRGWVATLMWPVGRVPFGPPRSRTSSSRASMADAAGQGWPGLHVPSISRAAMPESRIFGPSAHQIGPSPSQTAVGVQVKVCPSAITGVS